VAFGGPRPTQSERMIGTEPSPEGTSRQTVNGLLHEAGTTGRPLAGSGRLPNRGQRRDSLRREADLSAAPRLAGDGRSKIHVRGHAARASTANTAIFVGTATKRCQPPRASPSCSMRSTPTQRESSGDDVITAAVELRSAPDQGSRCSPRPVTASVRRMERGRNSD